MTLVNCVFKLMGIGQLLLNVFGQFCFEVDGNWSVVVEYIWSVVFEFYGFGQLFECLSSVVLKVANSRMFAISEVA